MADDTKKASQEISAGDGSENTVVGRDYTKHVHHHAPKESLIIKPTEDDFLKYDDKYRVLMRSVRENRAMRKMKIPNHSVKASSGGLFSLLVTLLTAGAVLYAVSEYFSDPEVIQEEPVPVQN